VRESKKGATVHTALSALRRGRATQTTARVRIHGGYEPDTIHARAGERILIVFRREETAACSERVVFPSFGKSAMLPPYQDVTVELEPREPGEYEFTCQMGMLHGRLIVDDGGARRGITATGSRSSPSSTRCCSADECISHTRAGYDDPGSGSQKGRPDERDDHLQRS
jgi:plastocyanin